MARKKSSDQDFAPAGNVIEKKLIENLIELQKVHVDLAEKFDKLAQQIANLLGLFEMAARSFAQHPANVGTEKDKEFLEKIDKLLDQNKTLAKGLTLMEERIRERVYGPASNISPAEESLEEEKEEEIKPSLLNRPLPRF